MSDDSVYVGRLRDSAEVLDGLLAAPSNTPLDKYADVEVLRSLALALSLEPETLNQDDLERLLLLRDGLYETLQASKDAADQGEHSIEQLISAVSRVYVDLEAVLRQRSAAISAAANAVAEMENTLQAPKAAVAQLRERIGADAREIISQINVSNRTININILNVSLKDVDLVRRLKINISRLSASVFAVKMQFEAGVVFEGVIRFLNEGVDRILSEIAQFARTLEAGFNDAKDLVTQLKPVLEKGTRFVRLIGSFIQSVFEDGEPARIEINLVVRSSYRSPAVLCACRLEGNRLLLGGRSGFLVTYNPSTTQLVRQNRVFDSDIRSLAYLGDEDQNVALGTSDGLAVHSMQKTRSVLRAAYRERVDAVGVAGWGGSGRAIVTGASDGALRRWSLSGGLSQFLEHMEKRDSVGKLGRSIQAILPVGDQMLVAYVDKLFLVDQSFGVRGEIPIERKISAMCAMNGDTVVVVGTGLIAEVNLARGAYSRMISVSPSTEYVAVAPLTEDVVVVGTSSGILRAVNLRTSAEVGEQDLDMTLRGLHVFGSTIVAFGGSWRAESVSVVTLQWQQVLLDAR